MKNFYYNLNGGLNTESTTIKMGAETSKLYWADAKNIEPYKNQGITRQSGSMPILKLQDNVIITGLFEYPKDSENFVVTTKTGKILHFDKGLSSVKEIHSLGFEAPRVHFSNFLDGLILLIPGKDAVYIKKTGSKFGVENLNPKKPNGEKILPTAVSQFAGRVFLSENDTVYYSALGTFNNWSSDHDAGYISKFHSSTGEIVALKEYAGSLAIYKASEVFLLSGNNPESFAIIKFADKGTLGADSVLTSNNKQYFVSKDGVFTLSQVGELSQIIMSTNIAKNIAGAFQTINKLAKKTSKVLSYEAKNAIWFFMPYQENGYLNKVLIYDYNLDCWYSRSIPYEITAAACIGGKIHTADAAGTVFVEDTGNTFASKPIEFKFSTPFFHFSKPSTPKIIDDFNIIFEGASDNTFQFSVSKNYNVEDKTPCELVKVVSINTLVWSEEGAEDNFTKWSEEGAVFCWAETIHENIKLDIFEANNSVQLHFEGTKQNENMTILGLEFKEIIFDE